MDLAISPLWWYGNRVKLSVTHANRIHVGVKRATLMMKSRRINTRPILCEGIFSFFLITELKGTSGEKKRPVIGFQGIFVTICEI